MFTLKSVGIDIGSSTSHLVFSRLTLRRQGAGHSAQFSVAQREVFHRSPVMLTPYHADDSNLLDAERIGAFVRTSYAEAGLTPEDIDTGAIVITGEALKKENARPILNIFAREFGKFICASAGPNHEALLAAHGCGAVALSKEGNNVVLNVDMGGGTAKLSLIESGLVSATASVEVGARLVAYDSKRRVTRIEKPARLMLESLGFQIELGKAFPLARELELCELMAKILFEVMEGSPSPISRDLLLTELLAPLPDLKRVDRIVFSGGVSEYIHARESKGYGDLGASFGAAMRARLARYKRPELVHEVPDGIRATVIGAGEFTIQASGSTSYLSNPDILPAFGLKVVRGSTAGGSLEASLRQSMRRVDLQEFGPGLALAVEITGQQDYRTLRNTAEQLAKLVAGTEPGAPLCLILDQDVARSLGTILKEELHMARDIVAVDGIEVGELDYVDVGRPLGKSDVVPVTVKSLIFPQRNYDLAAQ